MHCSSCERRFAAHVDGTLAPAERIRVAAHLDGCRPCRSLYEQLAAVEAALVHPRPFEPAPNFTFKTMAEVRAIPAPAVRREPLVAVAGAYLAFAWTIIALAFMLGGANARAMLAFLDLSAARMHAAFGGLAHASAHLFGGATSSVTTAVAIILFVDGVALAAMAVTFGVVRPRLSTLVANPPEALR
ncbi:MAG: zf-HC2 domain-containing protein [Vulcanimicrobiaceae bacterium]